MGKVEGSVENNSQVFRLSDRVSVVPLNDLENMENGTDFEEKRAWIHSLHVTEDNHLSCLRSWPRIQKKGV